MDIKKITAHDMLDFFKDITGRGVIDRKAFNKAKTLLNLIYDYANMDIPRTKNHLESGERSVPVSEEAKAILEELKKINGNKKYILQATKNAEFAVSTGNFNDHLREYCKNAGVTYYSSHKARFYGITELYEAGVPEHIIQYIAGHASVQMTQHYNRPDYTSEIDRGAWEKIFGCKG